VIPAKADSLSENPYAIYAQGFLIFDTINFMEYTIYTDGGSRGNPGIAGLGAVIKDKDGNNLREVSLPLGLKTNNYAEYHAVLSALEELKKVVPKENRKDVSVEVKMDSELVTKQLNGEYEIREETLFPFFIKIHNFMVSTFPNITFTHIPREENKEADALANAAMDEAEGKGSTKSLL